MARDASEALSVVSSQAIDLVLCDVKMPGINGLELVRQIHDLEPDLPCIVITGYGSAEASVEALHAGAYWYLEKPFEQERLDVVRRLVEQAIEHGRLKAENRMLHSALRSRYKFDNVIGKSAALMHTLSLVEKVADTDTTVLVTGESGTGKELIARALHYNSRRADRMMVTVNCGAIPEELLESELFGHVKGAFTNATHNREGRFAVADGGTIFLDEIGDMSPNLQVKLLRVLQERTFEPVGSSKTVRVDVRIIAATHRDLPSLIEENRFREDLFYRLNVFPIATPALRERREDIPLLVHHFLDVASQERGSPVDSISDEAMECLVAYDWPGNIRELENAVERLGDRGRRSPRAAAGRQRPVRDRRSAPPGGRHLAQCRRRPARARADQPGARAHPVEQEPRGPAPRPEPHDAAREDQEARADATVTSGRPGRADGTGSGERIFSLHPRARSVVTSEGCARPRAAAAAPPAERRFRNSDRRISSAR